MFKKEREVEGEKGRGRERERERGWMDGWREGGQNSEAMWIAARRREGGRREGGTREGVKREGGGRKAGREEGGTEHTPPFPPSPSSPASFHQICVSLSFSLPYLHQLQPLCPAGDHPAQSLLSSASTKGGRNFLD